MADIPRFRAEAHTRNNATTTNTITIPAAVESGDIGILVISTGAAIGSATLTAPSGWTTVVPQTAISSSGTMAVYTKNYQSGDTNPTVTSSGSQTMTACCVWYGESYGIGVLGSLTNRGSTTTTATAAAITTTSDQNVVLVAFAERGTGSGSMTTVTVTPDAVQRSLQIASGVSCPSTWIGEIQKPTAGATNAQTATYDDSSPTGTGVQLSLVPMPIGAIVVPTTDTGSTTTGWTGVGTGATFAARLGDSSDSTYAESAANPTNSVFQIAIPNTTVPSDLSTALFHFRARYVSGSSGSVVATLYQGASAIHTSPAKTLTTSFQTFAIALSVAEATGLTVTGGNTWQNLSIRLSATAAT